MDLFDFAKDGYAVQRTALEGFRLQKLEVYNWGTFDQHIWTFQLNGQTSLLTGDVGSGKSTLVDAISTLLLSPRKVNYNKAADSSSKERTTATYVRGFYGQQKGKHVALRGFDQYSVLLATFADEWHGETLTLAQFFYFREANASPVRFYMVADQELSIATTFVKFKNVTALRKTLKTQGINVYDSYNDYKERFCKKLGDLSDQALDLFGQTISMKKVDELTYFVRNSMLAKEDVSENIGNLLNHYSHLNSAHEAVLTAKKQIEMLQPIAKNGQDYQALARKLAQTEQIRALVPVWMAQKKHPLLTAESAKLARGIAQFAERITQQKQTIARTEENIDHILKEKYNNGGSRLESLKTERQNKQMQLARAEQNLKKYSNDARIANLPSAKTQTIFTENRAQIPCLQQQTLDAFTIENDRKTAISVALEQHFSEKTRIQTEIQSLEKRKSNIPDRLVQLRSRMMEKLGISSDDLPFVGELVEVRESQSEWEGAIERLLNSFAISMLVTEKDYPKVSAWVNQHSLQTKLVYYKTADENSRIAKVNDRAVYAKITVKQDSRFKNWVENWIYEKFDYLCCDQMESFRKAHKALSKEGQMKSGTRHEKDDRRTIDDRTRYVLGFSNHKKTLAYRENLKAVEQEFASCNRALQQCSAAIDKLNAVRFSLEKLQDFSEFLELDVKTLRAQLANYSRQIEEIETANDLFAKLEEQLQGLLCQKNSQTEHKDDLIAKKSKQEQLLEQLQQQVVANQALLQQPVQGEMQGFDRYESEVLTIKSCDGFERKIGEQLSREMKTMSEQCSKLEKSIEKSMQAFRFTHKLKSLELDSSIHSLSEYLTIYEKLMYDDLPKYEKEFKTMLHSNILRQISVFRNKLDNSYEKVKIRINEINKSLYSIDFNKDRYIKIEFSNIFDTEIKKFRAELRNCTSDIANDATLEDKFERIKKIIERFKGREHYGEIDRKWTNKVTDVRMWFEFAASERFRQTDEEYEHYADSNGKSGGQKEKLAYTILAASLVYNYGIDEKYDDSRSFRFVAIDEAFLKSSDESSKYGLELFQKLKFQLLVITPMVKIATIEPFVHHVGFVSHDDMKHLSSLQNIPIAEYQQQKERYLLEKK